MVILTVASTLLCYIPSTSSCLNWNFSPSWLRIPRVILYFHPNSFHDCYDSVFFTLSITLTASSKYPHLLPSTITVVSPPLTTAMKLLGWNCPGFRSKQDTTRVLKILRANKPDVVFLSETKLLNHECHGLRVSFGYDSCMPVSFVGRSGGLALVWNLHNSIDIFSFSRSHIDAAVDNRWWLMGFLWRARNFPSS